MWMRWLSGQHLAAAAQLAETVQNYLQRERELLINGGRPPTRTFNSDDATDGDRWPARLTPVHRITNTASFKMR